MLSRGSESATAETATQEFPLAVLEPANEATVEQEPPAVQRQLDFAVSAVAENTGDESAEVEALGEAEVPGNGTVSVAAIGEEICAFEPVGAGNCAGEEEIVDGDIFTATPINCSTYEVLGIVGDEVSSILVNPRQGPPYTVEVHDNIYLSQFAAERTHITGKDASGNNVFESWLPLDEYRAHNPACS